MLVFTDYWHPLEKGPIGVLTGLGVLLGCIVGLVFAVLSIKHRPRLFSLGTLVFFFNAIPIVATVLLITLQILGDYIPRR